MKLILTFFRLSLFFLILNSEVNCSTPKSRPCYQELGLFCSTDAGILYVANNRITPKQCTTHSIVKFEKESNNQTPLAIDPRLTDEVFYDLCANDNGQVVAVKSVSELNTDNKFYFIDSSNPEIAIESPIMLDSKEQPGIIDRVCLASDKVIVSINPVSCDAHQNKVIRVYSPESGCQAIGVAKNENGELFNQFPQSSKISSIYWDNTLERLFIGFSSNKRLNKEQNITAIFVGRLSGNDLILSPAIKEFPNPDYDNFIGTFGTSIPFKVSHLKVMHTPNPYLIAHVIHGEKDCGAFARIFALPLVSNDKNSNSEDIGKFSKIYDLENDEAEFKTPATEPQHLFSTSLTDITSLSDDDDIMNQSSNLIVGQFGAFITNPTAEFDFIEVSNRKIITYPKLGFQSTEFFAIHSNALFDENNKIIGWSAWKNESAKNFSSLGLEEKLARAKEETCRIFFRPKSWEAVGWIFVGTKNGLFVLANKTTGTGSLIYEIHSTRGSDFSSLSRLESDMENLYAATALLKLAAGKAFFGSKPKPLDLKPFDMKKITQINEEIISLKSDTNSEYLYILTRKKIYKLNPSSKDFSKLGKTIAHKILDLREVSDNSKILDFHIVNTKQKDTETTYLILTTENKVTLISNPDSELQEITDLFSVNSDTGSKITSSELIQAADFSNTQIVACVQTIDGNTVTYNLLLPKPVSH